ncbi:hypothetical protein JCM10908_000134 [Rhodotorula pacifica]|uniref:uncharacterized protein n=1 Tax=Rhodotorula pacifica TaxID=1495444 RepID=UPI003172230D
MQHTDAQGPDPIALREQFMFDHRLELEATAYQWSTLPLVETRRMMGRPPRDDSIGNDLAPLASSSRRLASRDDTFYSYSIMLDYEVQHFRRQTTWAFCDGQPETDWLSRTNLLGKRLLRRVILDVREYVNQLNSAREMLMFLSILTPPALWMRIHKYAKQAAAGHDEVTAPHAIVSSLEWLRGNVSNSLLVANPYKAAFEGRLLRMIAMFAGAVVEIWYNYHPDIQTRYTALIDAVVTRVVGSNNDDGPILAIQCLEHYTSEDIDRYIREANPHIPNFPGITGDMIINHTMYPPGAYSSLGFRTSVRYKRRLRDW